jgi:CRISPR-associated protein Cas8a1/Csx13
LAGKGGRMATVTITLRDPSMTEEMKVGLAGLYMSLEALNRSFNRDKQLKENFDKTGCSWKLADDRTIVIDYPDETLLKSFVKLLVEFSYQIDNKGIIKIPAHNTTSPNLRIDIHNAILGSIFQHGSNVKKNQNPTIGTVMIDTHPCVIFYKEVKSFNRLNNMVKGIDLQNNVMGISEIPNSAERLHGISKASEWIEPIERCLPSLFVAIGTIYFFKVNNNTFIDSNQIKKPFFCFRSVIMVFPHITSLPEYLKLYDSLMQDCNNRLGMVMNISEAACEIGLHEKLYKINEITSTLYYRILEFQVIGKQRNPAKIDTIPVKKEYIDQYEIARNVFPCGFKVCELVKGGKVLIYHSLLLKLIAENIIKRRKWYAGFVEMLIQTLDNDRNWTSGGFKKHESKGARMMLNNDKDEGLICDAVHRAMLNTFGAIGSTKKSGEDITNRFSKKVEEWQRMFLAAKTQIGFTNAVARFFGNGSYNDVLKANPHLIYKLRSKDWENMRSLIVLSILCYQGKGAAKIEQEIEENTEVNIEESVESDLVS